jgi:hypothetical protein
MLPCKGSEAKNPLFCKKFSTAFGGRPTGGILPRFALSGHRSARPTWQSWGLRERTASKVKLSEN